MRLVERALPLPWRRHSSRLRYVTGGIAHLFPATVEFARAARRVGRSAASPCRLADMRAANLLGYFGRVAVGEKTGCELHGAEILANRSGAGVVGLGET